MTAQTLYQSTASSLPIMSAEVGEFPMPSTTLPSNSHCPALASNRRCLCPSCLVLLATYPAIVKLCPSSRVAAHTTIATTSEYIIYEAQIR